MAEQSTQDVVTQSQSVGDLSPSDAPATTTNPDFIQSGEVNSVEEAQSKENGVHNPLSPKAEDFEDVSGRSDTDTSRADGSVADDKPAEAKTVKKFTAAKPVSFAKYSVPKVIAATAAAKPADRGRSPHPSTVKSDRADDASSIHTQFFHIFAPANRSSAVSCEDCQFTTAKGKSIQACRPRSYASLE